MDQTYMKQKPVLPLVVSMALPMTLSMLVNSLYNIVDSIFIAKISDNAMTALSLVYPIQNLITAITVGFAIGTNAVISIHLGAGNKKEADRAASLGTLLNAFHGLLLMIVCLTFIRPFLELRYSPPSWQPSKPSCVQLPEKFFQEILKFQSELRN